MFLGHTSIKTLFLSKKYYGPLNILLVMSFEEKQVSKQTHFMTYPRPLLNSKLLTPFCQYVVALDSILLYLGEHIFTKNETHRYECLSAKWYYWKDWCRESNHRCATTLRFKLFRICMYIELECWMCDFNLAVCFDVYDLNSDGYISREEANHMLKNCIVKVRIHIQ